MNHSAKPSGEVSVEIIPAKKSGQIPATLCNCGAQGVDHRSLCRYMVAFVMKHEKLNKSDAILWLILRQGIDMSNNTQNRLAREGLHYEYPQL
jgi:hypothetical protein